MAKRPQPTPPPDESSRVLPALLLVALAPAAWFAFAPANDSESPSPPAPGSPRAIAATLRAKHAPTLAATDAPLFEDATDELGIDFVHDNAAHGAYRLPENMGPGVAWVDVDGDDDLDLFVTGGGALFDEAATQSCRLYRNDDGRFVDVSAEWGADVRGHAYGVAAGDVDGDGDADLVVTRLGTTVLLRNEGGRFVDVSAASGIRDSSFGSSAVLFDFDGDADLDLLVGHYMDWTPQTEQECAGSTGARDYCDPTRYGVYAHNVLYRNRGDGTFEDVSEPAGLRRTDNQTLGLLASDFDGDGFVDVYVAEDSTPARLWRNRGDGTFAELAFEAGCAFDGRGQAIAGMGVACEDFDGDGQFDLLVTNIRGQSHLVLRNRGGRFRDVSDALGVPRWSSVPTGFGVAVFDADLDGEFDIYVANGAVAATVGAGPGRSPYAERDSFASWSNGRFVDRSARAGALCDGVGRGLALGDFDGDGDLDLAVAQNGDRLRILRNVQQGGSWLIVDVRDDRGAHAIGARVEIEHAGRKQRREIRAQFSYLSSHDPRAHFGLAGASTVERVRVTWPDGAFWSADQVLARTRVRVTRSEASAREKR